MKVLISHPTGNSFFRAAAEGLAGADMLAGFATTVATFPNNAFDKLSNIGPFAEFKRRQYNSILQPFATTWPLYELGRMAAIKTGLKKLTRHETGMFSVDGVYRNLDKHIAAGLKNKSQQGLDMVYAYEDGALCSFREAKRLGIQCIYDLPIGYWRSARKLLELELNRWPDWAATLTNFKDSEAKLANKDEELRLADAIFVASSFTASTLKDFPGKLAPVEVIPYGFPPIGAERLYSKFSHNTQLKLLFVGGLSQRKGIADLFAAVEAIGNKVTLTVVGHKATDDCPALDAALAKHRWIPSLPHAEVLKLMREHDVLVFPSLFEGFGLVITEAMSQGTPVITTDRTAGPDLINDGENGWLIEAGSTKALQIAIEKLLEQPEKIAEVGRAAMKTAERRPWAVYGEEFAKAINNCKAV